MEKMVLTFFKFKVIIPTEVNFMDCYHCFGKTSFLCTKTDIRIKNSRLHFNY